MALADPCHVNHWNSGWREGMDERNEKDDGWEERRQDYEEDREKKTTDQTDDDDNIYENDDEDEIKSINKHAGKRRCKESNCTDHENILDGEIDIDVEHDEEDGQNTEDQLFNRNAGKREGDVNNSADYEKNVSMDDLLEEEAENDVKHDEDAEEEDTHSIGGVDMKLYCSFHYPSELFQTMNEFRDSSLFTDLTMTTEDGLTIRAHSLVVAAVSSLVLLRLQWRAGDRKEEIQVCLGPEVSRLGLAAVLEFAYTGAVGSLNQDSVVQIQSAALALGVHRLLDLCEQEKEGKKKMEGKKEQEKNTRISAEEQLESSLQSIRLMLEERVDCDVELEARQRTFHAHRVLLAASCDYFRGMFTSGMRESKQSSVALMFVEDVELEALLRCSYTGTLMLGWDLVFDFTSTALQFQIQPALSLCLEFLHKEIHPQSCLDVISFAEAYEMGELRELAEDFVLRHFPEVSVTPKFQDLPVDKLLWYLQSNSLCVPSELVVFQAVMAWIQSDPRQRTKLARELMETIYFPLMTFKELKEAEAQTKWLKSNVESLYETVLEDFCSIGSNGNMQYRAYLPKDNLVLVGGEGITSDYANRKPSRALWFGNSLRNHTGIIKDVEWRTLGEMPEQPRFSHEVAVLRGQLYVAGGRHYYGREDVMNSMFRYDPLENNWRRLADMQEARSNFAMLVVGETIYAIGGDTDSEVNVDSVECYCSTTDAWRFTHPLDLALSSHAASVWQEKIFISGGFSRDCQCLTSILQYHPEKGTTHISDMIQSRAHHCMETLANHLYIAGGLSYDASSLCLDQLSCEIYDPRADSWCTIAPLPIPHVGAASCILEEKLYILGGYCQEDYNESRLVHRYDPATQRWENMGRMPGANTDIRACLLQIPSHLRK